MDKELNLTVMEAKHLPEDVLRKRFRLITLDIRDAFSVKSLPPDFPQDVAGMSRAEILAAVKEHAYWYDPLGGHPAPASSQRADSLRRRPAVSSRDRSEC
jgi:hypothetical protein